MEIRSFSEERAMPTVVQDTRTIEGYAVVFERESRIMFDPQKKRYFIEVIKRGAVTDEDLKKWDIKALMEHDKSRLLARSYNGEGTLKLSVDDYGVKYRFDAPKTTEGETALEMISRRDIFGSSFAYTADERSCVNYSKKSENLVLREVTKFDRMYDVSPVSDPAYFGTDVHARSLDSFFEEEKPKDEEIDESYKRGIEKIQNLINQY